MSHQYYPCVCTPSVVIPPPCDNCLIVPSVIIDPLTAPAPCGVVATVDIGTLSDTDVCTGTITWSILSYDTTAFTSVTINGSGVVTLTTSDDAVGGQEYTIIGKAVCSNSIHSRQFFIKLIVLDLCFGVEVEEGVTECDPCDGTVNPIEEAEIQLESEPTSNVTTADAVDDDAGNLTTGLLTQVDVTGNDIECNNDLDTTWELVAGTQVNCSVVDNGDGTFGVTVTADGAFSFQYRIICGVVEIDTAEVTGTGVPA